MADFPQLRDRLQRLSPDDPIKEYRPSRRAFSPERAALAHSEHRETCAVCVDTIDKGAPAFVDGTSRRAAHPSCFWLERKRAFGWYIGLTRRPEPAFDLSRAVLVESLWVTGCALNSCDWAIAPGQFIWRDMDNGRVCCQPCAARVRLAAARKGQR